MDPVNPRATPEARALLRRLHELSGRRILSGQHNNPGAISRFTEEVRELTGVYPAIYGQDFGFSNEEWDGVQYRDAIVREAIAWHRRGAIVTLMWHAVRPIDEEPGTFKGNVCCGPLSDGDWAALLTPGSEVHERWVRQADLVARLLALIRDEGIPVLWRPYHEMNGSWFWWGARPGPGGYEALYRMMFERYTVEHRLNNLLWVWNANAPRNDAQPYAGFYPGSDVVDALATDVYGNDYAQSHHDELVALAAGKPVALGEVGEMPTPAILRRQDRYVWFMTWGGFVRRNELARVRDLYGDPRMLNLGGEHHLRERPS